MLYLVATCRIYSCVVPLIEFLWLSSAIVRISRCGTSCSRSSRSNVSVYPRPSAVITRRFAATFPLERDKFLAPQSLHMPESDALAATVAKTLRQ